MIRLDYKTGGFPLSQRAPIICIVPDNQIKMAYNRFDLKKIMKDNKISLCFGVWLGQKTTDCFIIDAEEYTRIDIPECHKDIDSATDLRVSLDKYGALLEIKYKKNSIRVTSKEPELLEYIYKNGLKHTVSIDTDLW